MSRRQRPASTGATLACTWRPPPPQTARQPQGQRQLDQVEGPQHHPAAIARLTSSPTPAYRLSPKHYGVKAPTR
jgi:hypothetical protein